MKNDLLPFEKDLLRSINNTHKTRYTYKHLMEWGTDRYMIDKNLQEGEVVIEALGCYVTIKPEVSKRTT